jgi:hypothetical protein
MNYNIFVTQRSFINTIIKQAYEINTPSVRVYVIELLNELPIFTKFDMNVKPFEGTPASKILISHNQKQDGRAVLRGRQCTALHSWRRKI